MNWLKKLFGGNKYDNDPIWVLTCELLWYRAYFQKLYKKAHKLKLTSSLRDGQLSTAKQYLESLLSDLDSAVLMITQSGGRPLSVYNRVSHKLYQLVDSHSHSSDIQTLYDTGLTASYTMNKQFELLGGAASSFEALENVDYPVNPEILPLLELKLNKQRVSSGFK